MAPRYLMDAQQALSFLVNQLTYIEPQVYAIRYADIQYPDLVPVDTSAPEWTKSVTYYSTDKVGLARWVHHAATDFPLADIARSKLETTVELASIGYRYTLEEIGQAQQVPGMNLTTERADAARRAAEEFIDNVVMRGDTAKAYGGLINTAGVTVANVTGGTWAAKTGDAIAQDVNDALAGIYSGTQTVEMADTVLLPVAQWVQLATKRLGTAGESVNVMQWLRQNNVYTQTTGQALTIRAVRGLETAGATANARMVVYRKDPQVLKFHMPMPHRFMPVWQTGPLTFDVPGIFRLGGLDIRRPSAVRYVDGIA